MLKYKFEQQINPQRAIILIKEIDNYFIVAFVL